MTGSELLDGVKRRITMPANQYLLADDDILSFADDAISTHIVPLLMSVNWEFFVKTDSFVTVAGQSEYDINYRAVGRSLRDIKIRNTSSATDVRDLVYIQPEDSHLFLLQSEPVGFFFRGDQVVLAPTPQSANLTVEVSYFLTPGKMIQESDASKVTSVASNVVNVGSVPSTISPGAIVDFIKGRAGHRTMTIDYSVQSAGGTQITFADSAQTQYLVAGDYIVLAEQSPVVQLPPQCSQILKTLTGVYCLTAVDDVEGAKKLQEEGEKEKEGLMKVISPRVVGESRKIINRNGLIRGGSSNFFRGPSV